MYDVTTAMCQRSQPVAIISRFMSEKNETLSEMDWTETSFEVLKMYMSFCPHQRLMQFKALNLE